MTEKIQMTEEQAWKLLDETYCYSNNRELGVEKTLDAMKREGYICKSELQQKVEEAEEMYRQWQTLAHDDTLDINFQLIIKFQNVVQLLKQSHPEFK